MSRGFLLGKFLPPHQEHVLLCDFARSYADALTTLVSTLARDPVLNRIARPADLYLLCDVDMPWVDDGMRYFPDPAMRGHFAERCQAELSGRRLPYVALTGDWERRFGQAVMAIESRFSGANASSAPAGACGATAGSSFGGACKARQQAAGARGITPCQGCALSSSPMIDRPCIDAMPSAGPGMVILWASRRCRICG